MGLVKNGFTSTMLFEPIITKHLYFLASECDKESLNGKMMKKDEELLVAYSKIIRAIDMHGHVSLK